MSVMPSDDEEDETESGSSGSQSGDMEFHYIDPFASKPRDDELPTSEIKRLLQLHKELHESFVNKQKVTRQERHSEKQRPASATQQGRYASRATSYYRRHPISYKAQFSGIDKQVIGIPAKNEAQTNDDLRNELENRYQLRHAPQFNPKPRPH